MKSEQDVKSKLRKPRFRKRAIEKLLNKLLIELKIEDLDLVERLTYSLFEVISETLEGQRYSNDEIISIFEVDKSNQCDLNIIKDIPALLIHSDNLNRIDLKVKIGYIPKGLRISTDTLFRVVELIGKRIQTEIDFLNSVYYVLSKLLDTKDIAVYVDTSCGGYYFTNGVFKNNQALWQAFIK